MAKRSAGLLLYRITESVVEVLIGHPGGPFWARRDAGAWSIPKGEYTEAAGDDPGEDPWTTAQREFEEELGLPAPTGPRLALSSIKQPGGKVVTAFAVNGDLDITAAQSNTFELEWPKGSGTLREFPEIDRVAWVSVAKARVQLLKGQVGFLDRLMDSLNQLAGRPDLRGLNEGSAD